MKRVNSYFIVFSEQMPSGFLSSVLKSLCRLKVCILGYLAKSLKLILKRMEESLIFLDHAIFVIEIYYSFLTSVYKLVQICLN